MFFLFLYNTQLRSFNCPGKLKLEAHTFDAIPYLREPSNLTDFQSFLRFCGDFSVFYRASLVSPTGLARTSLITIRKHLAILPTKKERADDTTTPPDIPSNSCASSRQRPIHPQQQCLRRKLRSCLTLKAA